MNSSILSNAVAVSDGKVTTTSLKIAEVFGKRHDDVMRAVELLQVPDSFKKRNFAELEIPYKNGLGKTVMRKAYSITRDGFTLLVMGFTGAAAMQFKIAYLEEFNRMEAELRRLQAGISSVPSVSVRESPCSEQPELPLSAPCFAPEATYYGVPVMSTTALAERLGVTPGRIHSALQNNRAGLIDGIDLYRIKNAGELRAGGCGSAWGHMTNRVNLLTETGAGKMRAYLRNCLPVLPAGSVRPEVLPPVKAELPKPALDLPRLTRSRGAVTITGAEFRRKLGDCNLDVEKLLRKLSAAGYDVERELAELAYLCATVNRCCRGA
ncbi:MAG: hypothetical protein DBX90_13760, partial [Lentisphaerae bacterium]